MEWYTSQMIKQFSIDAPVGKTPKSVTIEPDNDYIVLVYRYFHRTEMFYGTIAYVYAIGYPIDITE